MNEILFFLHTGILVFFVLGALRLGKEALIALFGLQAVLANLFVIKQITLFGFIITPTDAFSIGCMFCLNLMREFYGKAASKKALWIAFFLLAFFAVMGKTHLLYKPHVSDVSQDAFVTVLSHSPRILFASILVFFIVQHIDLRIYSFLQKKWNAKWLPLRFALSISISELIDTILFSFIGLYGLVTAMGDVILLSFTVKMLSLLLMIPFTALSKRIISHEI